MSCPSDGCVDLSFSPTGERPAHHHTSLSEVIFLREGRGLRFQKQRQDSSQLSAYESALLNLSRYTGAERKWWSRAKAYTLDPITPAMWGLMKVAGKRLYQVNPLALESLWAEIQIKQEFLITHSDRRGHICSKPSDQAIRFTSVREATLWLDTWVKVENERRLSIGQGESRTEGRRWGGQCRTVGAIALDHELKIIAQSLNRPDLDHTAHAERLLLEAVQGLHQSALPRALYLISSLKPCKMCAGMWVSVPLASELSVIYIEEDLGANGQNTALDKGSYAWVEAKRWRCAFGSLSQVKLAL